MKIRKGFVSNSSTASFCLIGIKTTEEDFLKKLSVTQEEFAETYNYDFNTLFEKKGLKLEIVQDDGPLYVGKKLSYIYGGEGVDEIVLSFDQLQKEVMDMAKMLGMPPEKMMLYSGEVAC